MANDELIAALKAAYATMADTGTPGVKEPARAALIRDHIAEIEAGDRRYGDVAMATAFGCGFDEGAAEERAKMVAYAHGQADCWKNEGNNPQAAFVLIDFAKAIASGAHMENNNAD